MRDRRAPSARAAGGGKTHHAQKLSQKLGERDQRQPPSEQGGREHTSLALAQLVFWQVVDDEHAQRVSAVQAVELQMKLSAW